MTTTGASRGRRAAAVLFGLVLLAAACGGGGGENDRVASGGDEGAAVSGGGDGSTRAGAPGDEADGADGATGASADEDDGRGDDDAGGSGTSDEDDDGGGDDTGVRSGDPGDGGAEAPPSLAGDGATRIRGARAADTTSGRTKAPTSGDDGGGTVPTTGPPTPVPTTGPPTTGIGPTTMPTTAPPAPTTTAPYTVPPGCAVGPPLSGTTTITSGGGAAGARVDRTGVGLAIGHSNGARTFPVFVSQARAVSDFPWVVAAQGGQDSASWARTDEPWSLVDQRLAEGGWSAGDVQVVVAILSRSTGDPDDWGPVLEYRDVDLPALLARLEARYPNLELVYVVGRESGRFKSGRNGEPSAYRHGLATRSFAAAYRGRATVLAGPYLWDDATCRRSDGLVTDRSHFASDGVHPSEAGRALFASFMVDYFLDHPSSAAWFRR